MSTSTNDSDTHEIPQYGIVRRDSIEELVGHRNSALQLAKQGLELLVAAESAAKRAAPQDDYAGFIDALVRDRLFELCSKGATDKAMKIVQKEVDCHAWASLQQLSGLRNIMDATAHEEMSGQLIDDPPPFTIENVTATFEALAAKAPLIFTRSLVNVFQQLNTKDYKTNSAFRITPRIILTYTFSDYGYNYHWNRRDLIADLDRIFHTLDGKKPPEAGNASDAIEAAYTKRLDTCTTDYFEVRMFRGNGNLHLKFRRLDLLDRANDMIARHFGETLADNTKR